MPKTAIAVVGMAARFPGARNVVEFWRNLRAGVESLEQFTDEELLAVGVSAQMLADPRYVKAGTALERSADFDAAFFGVNPREADVMDPQHRIFLECAWEAVEDAGYCVDRLDVPVGVFAGASMNSYIFANLAANPEAVAAVGGYQVMIGNDKDFLATRVSYKLNLRGPSLTVQTACSTSLVAVHVACESLLTHQCDMALAGGVSLSFPQRSGYLYQEGMIASPDAKVRPFDAKGKGIRAGEGVGLVVLKRLEDAIADGDTIRAVILGTAINNDGAQKIGYTAPSVDGQAEAIATAQSIADVAPDTISYIEAHGTSTPLGDPIEIAALDKVFRAQTRERQFCAIGSVKSNIGHLDAAAGVAGLIKTVLALEHGEIPASLNFQSPNPQIDFEDSAFFVNAKLRAWVSKGPRRAGVSSFGIGGTNAHAVLEEWPRADAPAEAAPEQPIVLSARSAEALDAMRVRLADFLAGTPQTRLEDLAFTLQTGRRVFDHRAIYFAGDVAGAQKALRDNRPAGRTQGAAGQRGVAFMFSGQGSQYRGMGWAAYQSEPAFRAALDTCAEALKLPLGLDLRAVLYPQYAQAHGLPEPDEDALNETWLTQPALFAVEYALAKLWEEWGVTPAAMIGHSIGEYVAACLAGVFTLDAALELVATRGALMHKAEPGAMLAVPLDDAQVAPYLRDGLAVAALNAPGSCVLSGPVPVIEAVQHQLERAGVSCRRLRTSHAFHSPMMDSVVPPFVAVVSKHVLSAPKIPFVSNVTGSWITPQQATDPAYWGRHLRGAVRFADGIRALAGDSSRLLIEVGPGDTLKTLARQSLGGKADEGLLTSLPHPLDKQPAEPFVRRALARAWLAGAPVKWSALYAARKPRRIPLPTYPFESRRFWVEPLTANARTAAASEGDSGVRIVRKPLEDWYWLPSWRRGRALSAQDSARVQQGGRWLVFDDASPAGSALIASLRERGVEAAIVRRGDTFSVRPEATCIRAGERDDYGRLFESRVDFDCVLHLWNTAPCEGVAVDAERGRRDAFYSLLFLAQALGDANLRAPLPVLVVSTDMQRVLGDEALCVDRSLLIGPVFVMSQDVPMLRARSIDLSAADWRESRSVAHADALRTEAANSIGANVVAWRGGYRWEQTTAAMELHADSHAPLRDRGVYLITGGTGGLGLAIARDLAKRERARLVLTSRSGAPAGEAWAQTVHELEASGAEVLVIAADCADAQRMGEVIAQTRARFGALNGVIHAAGLPGRGILQLKTREQTEAVLRPKVDGTLILDQALAGAGLDFFALFSTINTAFGWHGTTDYSSANAFLDSFAQAGVARCSTRVVTINWGTWREVGMAAAFAAESGTAQSDGMLHAISPAEGVEAFRRVLASGAPQVYVTPIPMPDVVAGFTAAAAQIQKGHGADLAASAPASAAPAGKTPAAKHHERPTLEAEFVAPRDAHEQNLAEIWSDLLGIAPIGADDNFFELGGHSLLATRVLSRLQDAFKVGLPMRAIFEAPTVATLAERIRGAQGPAARDSLGTQEEREEIEL